jgi:hypothetical protein
MKIIVIALLCSVCSTTAFQKFSSSRVTLKHSQRLNVATFPGGKVTDENQGKISDENRVSDAVPQVKLTPEDFIRLTKEYLADPSPDRMAEDFVFRGPVIGPIAKKDIVNTIKGVAGNMNTAFPDMEQNAFGFSCDDPIEPTRVWYFVRPRATFKGPFTNFAGMSIPPTGKKLIGPPEARSFVFNEQGKIKYQTVGYVTDRFTGDTTAGKGAIFGLVSYVHIYIYFYSL